MITVLGKTFNTEEERREYFKEELRKKLPDLKLLDGFPIGEDEDILNLSDAPYYTACPNPWLNDFIEEWEQEKANISNRDPYFQQLEPYAADVSEGKNNPIYNAHSYHTKVPHPAIMRYILHYTQPGDIILDGFCGTGMTGVAAQMCGNPEPEFKYKLETEWKRSGKGQPAWGARKAILGDLSPIASFISYNYNTPVDILEFSQEANRILDEVEEECAWMYETTHTDGSKGKINYVVWSDVFTCNNCNGEIVFWDVAVDRANDQVKEAFNCTHCNTKQNKKTTSKTWITKFDKALNETIQQTKSVPVMINYSVGKKRFEKQPDNNDFLLIEKIEEIDTPYWYPTYELPDGYNTRQPKKSNGFINTHHFYTKRNNMFFSFLMNKILFNKSQRAKLVFTSILINTSKLYAWRLNGKGGDVSGTLYIPSTNQENNVYNCFKPKIKKLCFSVNNHNLTQINSANNFLLVNNSIDYIFTDPPFGANIMYSELNSLWESWLKVRTNNSKEAIENKVQGKGFNEYQELMTYSFKEYYRVLKPGKWMTVEFSNTSAIIWNGIQTALQKAGFVIANVSALDKQQGSFKAVTTLTAVKQDLVISCYKPSEEFLQKFETEKTEQVGVWDFVLEHLHHLPIHLTKENNTTAVIERSPKIIYDRLISFYLMRNLAIPIDARAFQEGLKQRFTERDGMYFTPEQVVEYDQKKAKTPNFTQLALIVTTENEGIEWLRAKLNEQAMSYQDLQPNWMQAITAIQKGNILPELRNILQENFIQEADGNWRVPDMNEQKDRDALRNKALLKEFAKYVEEVDKPKGKLKEVRVEALRAGFEHCRQQKAYDVLIKVAERMPQNILLEDEFLLMYYDNAKDKV